jgi:hypothetical protein
MEAGASAGASVDGTPRAGGAVSLGPAAVLDLTGGAPVIQSISDILRQELHGSINLAA